MRETSAGTTTAQRALGALAFLVMLPLACRWAVGHFEPALVLSGDGGALPWINALLVAAFVLVLWTLSGRALLSLWLGWWALWLLHALNEAKLEQLQRTLAPADLALLGQVLGNLDLFARYLVVDGWAIAAVLLATAVAGLLAWREPRTLPRLRWRVPLLAASIALVASLLAGHAFWRSHLDDARLGGFEIWWPAPSVQRSGLVAGLLRLGWQREDEVPPPTPAESEELAQFLVRHQERIAGLGRVPPPLRLPDLVVVQSEALFDPGLLRGIDSADWLPAFRALQQRGMHGSLSVPAYGGGTIRTEFEVLTGYPMAAFPEVSYPYYGLTERPLPALPAQLARQGYRRFAVHPYERNFWNRDVALQRLGFEQAYFDGDPPFSDPRRRGPYVTDEDAYRATLELLQSDRPQFAFVITMENHSPWRHRDNIDKQERDAIAVPEGLDEEARKALGTYLLHLHHGDAALAHFAQALLARSRPTVLLVYGDHLPSLARVYSQLGFDDGGEPWSQRVPYALVANFPIPARRRDLSAHELPAVLMQVAGLPLTGHLAMVAAAMEDACGDRGSCDLPIRLAVTSTRMDYLR